MMKKKIVLFVAGSALLLSACGSAATPSAATEPAAAIESSAAETAAASQEAGSAAPGTESAAPESESSPSGGEISEFKEVAPDADGRISNGFISITLPKELEGTYTAFCNDSDIDIYDKACSDAGFGGFVFGVCAVDDYSEYGGMRTKIGELTDKDGKLYHVLISHPSDVQWDYTKSDAPPATYSAISDRQKDIISTLTPDGGGTFTEGGGTKGADIYGNLVKDMIEKIRNAKDSNELEAEDLSPVYYAMTQGANPRDPMKDIGAAYVDINLDGVDDMLVGDISSREIYDIYTSVDGKPAHVASGHWRDYYKVYNSFVSEYTLEGAGITTIYETSLLPNSTELFSQYAVRLDETDEKNPKYYESYDVEADEWEEVDKEEYERRIGLIEDNTSPIKYDLTPLGEM